MREKRCSFAWWLLAALLAPLPALPAGTQDSGQQPPEVPQSLRAVTRLVQVSVIVQDRQGAPVGDLTRDDFVVLDEGKEQQVSVFAVESDQPLATPTAAVPPGPFSNRLELHSATPASVTIILFDGLNTRFPDQAYARDQVIKFLKQLRSGDRVALYLLARGPQVAYEFTDDPDLLVRALARFESPGSPESPLIEPEGPTFGIERLGAWLEEIKDNLIDTYDRDRALRTVRTIVAIAHHVARLPGRKNLVWVSGSFPFRIGRNSFPSPQELARDTQTLLPEIERAVRALNDANLAIYPVDARGLLTPPEFSPDRGSISRQSQGLSRREFNPMLELAERTGGQAFYNTNDIYAAVRRAVEDSRLSYVLGYYPTHGKWNGRFRHIKVRVKRSGLQLRHRRGYFALAEEPPDAATRQAVLDAAMWSPLDATRLGLTVQVSAAPAPGPPVLDLTLEIDPRDVTLQKRNGNWEGALDLFMVQLSADSRNLKGVSHLASLRLNDKALGQAMSEKALRLSARLEIVPAAKLLRILVRDIASGALGSVSIPLSRVLPGRGL